MEVGQVVGRVRTRRVVVVAHVTRLGRAGDARLSAVVLRLVADPARVGRLDGHVERRVDERRIAALSSSGGVVTRSQTGPAPGRLRGGRRRHECQRRGQNDDHTPLHRHFVKTRRLERPCTSSSVLSAAVYGALRPSTAITYRERQSTAIERVRTRGRSQKYSIEHAVDDRSEPSMFDF